MMELYENGWIGSRALCELLHNAALSENKDVHWLEDACFFEVGSPHHVHVSLLEFDGSALVTETGGHNVEDGVRHFVGVSEGRDAYEALCEQYRYFEAGGE